MLRYQGNTVLKDCLLPKKDNSTMNDIISILRSSYLGKLVDEEFLSDLKSLLENKIVAAYLMKPAIVPSEESVSNTEIKCLPLPNEILVKIFGYLNIQDISRCAQVSCQFNTISKDSSLWKSSPS